MTEPGPTSDGSRFPWRAAFARAALPVFVVGGDRRLRYANPAWEALAGKPLAKLRGMRVSARKSASELGRVLAPPPEAWAGRPTAARRPPPGTDAGPPWWDLTFLPLPGASGRAFAVVGTVEPVGEAVPKAVARAVPSAVAELRRGRAAWFTLDRFAGTGPACDRLLSQARLAASTDVPAWVVGEPGSGKEALARAVHAAGPRRAKAFVAIDATGVQPYLTDGLLFGKGGLLGSGQAGTLYLKEPAALPRDLQDRLTRAAQPPRPGVPRLICGSTRPASDDVAAGRLLPVFQGELSALEVRLPPLRDRLADLPRFAATLLERFPTANGSTVRLADDAWPALRAHDWPGNLREFADVLGSAAGRAGGGPIQRTHLPRFVQEKRLIAERPPAPAGPGWTLDGVLEAAERRLIALALAKANGSQTDAAAALGIPRARLARRIEALGIGTP